MLPRDHYLKQSFQDLAHFPNGFEKGGLSDIQARLVRKNGALINALCIDEVSDATPDDLHILKVIANQSAPKNPVEQAWIKYLSIIKSLENSSPSKSKAAKAKAAKPVAAEAEEEPDEVVEPVKPVAKAPIKPAPKAVKASKPAPEEKPAPTKAKKAATKVEEPVKAVSKASKTK